MLRTGERLGGDASPYRGRSLRLNRQAMLGTGERLGGDASPLPRAKPPAEPASHVADR